MKGKMAGAVVFLGLLGASSAFAALGHPGLFKQLDINHDGLISRQEAAPSPFLAKHFDAIDTNHDGQISRAEMKAFRQAQAARFQTRFQQADANHNGVLSRTEAQAMPQIARSFDQIDANHDGQVTMQEIRAFHRAQQLRRGESR
jgi:Ca2+-binding EF-hand superfamily protein